MTELVGMDRTTGQTITGADVTVQQIADVLTTPLGTRVMRRDYGSLLFDLADMPLNAATMLLQNMAAAQAITQWVNGVTVNRAAISGDFASGQATLDLSATIAGNAQNQTSLAVLSIPLSTQG